jgi:hypothetical protein
VDGRCGLSLPPVLQVQVVLKAALVTGAASSFSS